MTRIIYGHVMIEQLVTEALLLTTVSRLIHKYK